MSVDVYCSADTLVDVYAGGDALDVVVAAQGPQGPPGIASFGFSRYPNASLGGQRVVRDAGDGIHCQYADPANLGDADLVLGVTVTAGGTTDLISIQADGEMHDPSFSFTPGLDVYCGTAGAIVQTPPSGRWIRRIGFAVSATKMVIDIWPPIFNP